LAPLDGSLLIQMRQKGQIGWRAKHPTVLDAFATLVAADRELMDIYLIGTPARQLLREITCGGTRFGGIKVEVPMDRYDGLVGRIQAFHAEHYESHDAINTFLAHQCGRDFLKLYIERSPGFTKQLHVTPYFDAVTSIDVLNKLHKFGLLPEDQRIKHAVTVRELAVQTPDAGFLDSNTVSFLTEDEIEEILCDIREALLHNMRREIESWKQNFSDSESPSDYFEPFRTALSKFATVLAYDSQTIALINEGLSAIDEAVAELDSQDAPEPEYGDYYHRGTAASPGFTSRSIFDDVDE
jgi:hypothetical protein